MSKILITGGTGFLGRHLAAKLKPNHDVLLAARNNGINSLAYETTGCQVAPLDVSNIESVRDVFNEFSPNIVIHAAATKYVDLSEKHALECIDVNVLGSANVARVAIDKGVDTFIGISTDKTAPPVGNTYGLSKALMERLFCSLDAKSKTKFACVRFGNITWSTGSVFPIWKRMTEKSGVVQSTGPEMRRFFFSVDDAADLVIRAMNHIDNLNGKVLLQKMKSAQIEDILNVWSKHFQVPWEKIERRPGDKLDESLIGSIELENTVENDIDGIAHYVITFNERFKDHVPEAISSKNAERLADSEILNLITSIPDMV
jgi:UDP-N-acetylglucosamine 4,6-dehydratase/5-epimerase